MAAAARSLGLSPSAVAQQLHALERELDAPLIARVGRTVRITEAGARVLLPARKLLRDSSDLRSIANDEALAGELRLGACTTAMTGLLPEILARMSAKFPRIKVFLRATGSAQLYGEVEAGHLDAALVLEAPFPLPKTCSWHLLREEPLVVLARRAQCDADAHALLRTEPFIRYDRNQWGGRHADEYLRAVGIVPRERFELNVLGAIAVMVDRGLGVTLVPDWAPPWPEALDIARIALPKRSIGRRVGIVWSGTTIRMRLVQTLLEESIALFGSGSSLPGSRADRISTWNPSVV